MESQANLPQWLIRGDFDSLASRTPDNSSILNFVQPVYYNLNCCTAVVGFKWFSSGMF